MREAGHRGKPATCPSAGIAPHPTSADAEATFSRKREKERAAVVVAACLLTTQALAADCPATGDAPAVVAMMAPRGELKLADGRLIRLAGFDPALATPGDLDLGETLRAKLAAKAAGKSVKLKLLAERPDRWGRFPALVFVDGGSTEAGGLAAAAVAAGLGRYLAEPAAHACRAAFVAAETAARQAKLGLWADPYYGVLAVDDAAGFAERAGTIVIAEGSVTAVQPGPFRTTLRFAAPGQRSRGMLVATIVPRVSKTFVAQRIDVSRYVGRRVRVRGLLDLRFGPRIELNSPDDIDVLDAPATPATPKPN